MEDIGYTGKVVLVPDDGDAINNIIVETKHILHITLTAKGVEAHANRPWNGVNAIENLIVTYNSLRAHFGDFSVVPEDIWVNTINIGTISGGVATNEVAGDGKMTIDIRFVNGTSKKEVLNWIKSSLALGVSYTIDMEGCPTKLDIENLFVQNYKRCVEKHSGKKVVFVKAGGGTDARFFSAKGMLTIVHQGNGGGAQSDNEYVEIEELNKLIAIHTDFILHTCS